MHFEKIAPAARRVCLLAFLTAGSPPARAEDTLRIATYNLLKYPNDAAGRNPWFRTVLRTLNPDVLVVQEMTSSSGVTQFRDDVLNAGQPGAYTAVPFNDGPDTDNAMFYRTSALTFIGAAYISTALRNIAEYRFRPSGSSDTIRLYSVHLKANQEDSLTRLAEATILRNHLNALPAGAKFIVAGDFNIYRSTEPAFLKLTGSEGDNDGRSKDPLNAVGTWHAAYGFRAIHTQSTRTREFGDGTTGGLDDRFDMLLVSYPMDPHLLSATYTEYGNDGNHFNDSINRLPNAAVPDSVANALHYAGDHLPVFADFRFGTSGPDTGYISIATGGWNTPGIWSGGAVPSAGSTVTIAGGTTVTVDGAAVCGPLIVSGVLQFDAVDGRTLTAGGELRVNSGGELRASAPFSSGNTTQSLLLSGSFLNDGVFTPRVAGSSSGTRVLAVTLTGSLPLTIGGNTDPATFHSLRMNLASTVQILSPQVSIGFTGGSGSTLTLSRGTWVQGAGSTVTPGVNITVDTNAVLSIGEGGAFGTGSASLLVRGVLDISGGALTVGGGNNRLEILPGGAARFSGGAALVNGRLTLTAGETEILGGSLSINPRGTTNLAPTSNVFEAAAAASVSMTGGTLTIVNPRTATSTGREVRVTPGSGLKSFSGGTIAFGDGTSLTAGSDSGFVVESAVALPRILLRTGGVAGRDLTLAAPLSAGSVDLQSGALRLAEPWGADLSVAGSLRRTGGTLSAGARTITLTTPPSATVDTIAGDFTGQNAFGILAVNASAGVRLSGDIVVRQSLTISSGVVRTGSSAVELDSLCTFSEPAGQPLTGTLRTTRLVLQGVPNDFGGVGVELLASDAAPGPTVVTRSTDSAFTAGFASSILRSFRISPSNNAGLNARLVFRYDPAELDGQEEETLRLWRSTDEGTTWENRRGAVNTAQHSLETDSIGALSLWTASDAANPLQQVLLPVTVAPGWNLLAVPVFTTEDSIGQVYPGCPGSGYGFGFDPDSGYFPTRRMAPGRGYWLKCPSGSTAVVQGGEVDSLTLAVHRGWNILGTITVPVDTGTVIQTPPGIVLSAYFGFDGSYTAAPTLIPGRGYWVKIGAPGSLTLRSPLRR